MASTTPQHTSNSTTASDAETTGHPNPQQAQLPPGALAIYQACASIYKTQPNPLQVTAVKKYWLDGPDPLDYISMYENPGDQTRAIPPHWHYVSLGLSDLHGDSRVHERASSEEPSGYGFELTFRLKRENSETAPPTWPAMLMQALARYVFQSENILQGGDHVSWHAPLDTTDSRIQHMLMAEDAQLSAIKTGLGHVGFIQIVGVCAEELKAAQHWNGPGVLELLRSIPVAGGAWLITDMRRGETIFELDPGLQERLEQGIEQEGSNLSGVSGFVIWEELIDNQESGDQNSTQNGSQDSVAMTQKDTEKIRHMLQKGLRSSHHQPSHSNTSEGRKASIDSTYSGDGDRDHPVELMRTKTLDGVHLKFNAETGSLLPLALRSRLKHGRHFTFKSTMNEAAVTLVSPSEEGSIVDSEHPYATHDLWLQVLLDEPFLDRLSQQLDFLSDIPQVKLPKLLAWPDKKLTITVLPDAVLNLR